MTAQTDEMSVQLPCHRCGYDLRAHPPDGECPECGASVAEARRVATVPIRPAWRDSDPRWRRRMVAGVWILALVPLVDALKALGWASSVPVPNVFGFPGTVRTLDETLLCTMGVYAPVAFCSGVVLLFAKERGRRPGRFDWTRRWGVACSYIALLLSATSVLFLVALVSAGIAQILQGMPPKYQPWATPWFVEISAAYLRYGPQPSDGSEVASVAFSSAAVLLACVPLYDALRSSGPKHLAAMPLIPLAMFALWYVFQSGTYCLGFVGVMSSELFRYRIYFWPELLTAALSRGQPMPGLSVSGAASAFVVEVLKWCIVLAIAVWLTVAQFATWRKRKKTSAT
jgi:hypothetical protein